MFNELIRLKLEYWVNHITAIEEYASNIKTWQDLRTKNNGLNYDAILMRLQALSELLKKLSQSQKEVIETLNYRDINDVIKFRDYVSHHYESLEHEIVFDICRRNIPELKNCLQVLVARL